MLPIPESLQLLDDWLRQSEPDADQLQPGAGKKITWHSADAPQRTERVIVYLHGFSATRQELWPLPQELATALQCNLFETRLHGHGLKRDALENLAVEKFLEDGEQALQIAQRLGSRPIILAASTGASLATLLAAKGLLPEQTVLLYLSPNFGTRKLAGELLMLPWLRPLLLWIYGTQREYEPISPAHAACWTSSYPSRALFPVLDLVKMARQSPLEQLQNPLLLLFSSRDKTVSVAKMRAAFRRFGSPLKRMLEIRSADPNQHTLAGDLLAPESTGEVAEAILDFIADVDQGRP